MNRCLALLLVLLLLLCPPPEFGRALAAARLAGEAVYALELPRPDLLAAVSRLDSVEVRLPEARADLSAGEALILLRSRSGARRCFALRPATPGLPARLSLRPAPSSGSDLDWVRVPKAGIFSILLLNRP